MPILLWGNGACKSSNHQYWDVLGAIAARGYIVVAFGAAEQVVVKESNTVTPSRMAASIEWATSQINRQAGYELADPTKLGVFGTSCGGLEALVAGADSRVKSIGALNTGFFDKGSATSISQGGYSVENVANLVAPTLFMGGGASDVAYKQTHTNYDASKVKTVLAENPQGGHSGLWAGLRYTISDSDPAVATGSTVDYTITTESVESLVRWFDWTLNGRTPESEFFLGTNCGLCQKTGWSVQSKNY